MTSVLKRSISRFLAAVLAASLTWVSPGISAYAAAGKARPTPPPRPAAAPSASIPHIDPLKLGALPVVPPASKIVPLPGAAAEKVPVAPLPSPLPANVVPIAPFLNAADPAAPGAANTPEPGRRDASESLPSLARSEETAGAAFDGGYEFDPKAFEHARLPSKITMLQDLGRADPETASGVTAKIIADSQSSRELRIAALRVLESLPPEQSAPALLKVALDAKNDVWYLRREAARSLDLKRETLELPKSAVAPLHALYKDKKADASLRATVGKLLRGHGIAAGPLEFREPLIQREWGRLMKKIGHYSLWGGMALLSAAAAWFAFSSLRDAMRPDEKPGVSAPVEPPKAAAAEKQQADKPVAKPAEGPGPDPKNPKAGEAPAKTEPAKALSPEEKLKQDLQKIKDDEAKRKKEIDEDFKRRMAELEADSGPSGSGFMGSFITMIMVLSGIAIIVSVVFMIAQASGKNFLMNHNISTAEKPTTRFKDVAGIDDVQEDVQQIVDMLKRPQAYRALVPDRPKGILLEGPPGTGKTLLARAVAGEVGGHFLAVSGSDFVEIFVGKGAGRVRALFKRARKLAKESGQPVIIFIDEIDAVGGKRGGPRSSMTGNDEREQTLNQLLAELDGFSKDENIMIMGATNQIEKLDSALIRDGRFDLKLHVGIPDTLGREAILSVHAGKTRLAADADLTEVAQNASGLSGAYLKGLINKAGLHALKHKRNAVAQEDLLEAVDREIVGAERGIVLPPDIKARTAYHEAGHTLTALDLGIFKVPKVTIVPHGAGALGFAWIGDSGDRFINSKSELEKRLVTLMGSYIAENIVYAGDTANGVSNDLERATDIAERMVNEWGMAREAVGLRVLKSEGPMNQPLVSQATLEARDKAVEAILLKAFGQAQEIIERRRAGLEALAQALIQKETLGGEEIRRLIGIPETPAAVPASIRPSAPPATETPAAPQAARRQGPPWGKMALGLALAVGTWGLQQLGGPELAFGGMAMVAGVLNRAPTPKPDGELLLKLIEDERLPGQMVSMTHASEMGERLGWDTSRSIKAAEALADAGRLAALSNGYYLFLNLENPPRAILSDPELAAGEALARQAVRHLNADGFGDPFAALALSDEAYGRYRKAAGNDTADNALLASRLEQLRLLRSNALFESLRALATHWRDRLSARGVKSDPALEALSDWLYDAYAESDRLPTRPRPAVYHRLRAAVAAFDTARLPQGAGNAAMVKGVALAVSLAKAMAPPAVLVVEHHERRPVEAANYVRARWDLLKQLLLQQDRKLDMEGVESGDEPRTRLKRLLEAIPGPQAVAALSKTERVAFLGALSGLKPGDETTRKAIDIVSRELAAPQDASQSAEILLLPAPAKENDGLIAEDDEKFKALNAFGVNLTRAAKEGGLDPWVGDPELLDRIAQVLGERRGNNPVLIGEPGVGKTAMVHGFVSAVLAGRYPKFQGVNFYSLDMSLIAAGTKFRGELEGRVKAILAEAKASKGRVVFVVDEVHDMIGAGKADGGASVSSMLKKPLEEGWLRVLGTTTEDEWQKRIEDKDPAIVRRLGPIWLESPDAAQAVKIVTDGSAPYAREHGVEYSAETLSAAVSFAEQYLPHLKLPASAFKLLDKAGSRRALKNSRAQASGKAADPVVTAADIALEVAAITGIPVGPDRAERLKRVETLFEDLRKVVVGQDHILRAVTDAVIRYEAGLKNPNKPIGVFLFLGPTGVGKTLVAKALAKYLFGSEKRMVKIPMSKYSEKHSVSGLRGTTQGYVGYDDQGILTKQVRRHPYSVVLLDEVEKAHPEVFDDLLDAIDEGESQDSRGRTVRFKDTLIIMTSNLGGGAAENKPRMGFVVTDAPDRVQASERVQEAKGFFRPEFMGRLGEENVLTFNDLSRDQLSDILDQKLALVHEQTLAPKGLALALTEAARELLLERAAALRKGARPLDQLIENWVMTALGYFLMASANRELPAGTRLSADAENGKIIVRKEP